MRYLLFLIGVDFSDKQRMDKKLKGLKYEGLKYIFTSGAIMVHIKTDECKDKLKSDISEIAMDLSCLYFLSDFPDKLSCNLGDDDAKYLFDFTYDVEIESEFDFNFNLEEDEDDDDDGDNDLVQMLKDKFSVKGKEPSLDEILDKINQKGVSSLSIQEQAILKNYN
jgi:hypothetical protein